MRGADTVIREIIRGSVATIFDEYFTGTNTQQIEQWFNLGGAVRIDDDQPSQAILEELKQIQGLFSQLSPISVKVSDAPEVAVSGAEFLLEGMYAHKRLSRSEERGFSAQEKATRKQERVEQDRDYDEFQEQRRTRRGFN